MSNTDPTHRRTQSASDRGDHAVDRERGASTRSATTVERNTVDHDHTTRDVFIGTDEDRHRSANVSWGAIFAGVVTFVALMFVFGLVSLGLGLSEAGGIAVGIWSALALIVAMALAGFLAGVLSVRAGFLHGMATWATSVVAMLVLIGWLGASALGALGGAVGNLAQGMAQGTEITTEDLGAAAEDADVDQQDLDQAQQQAEDTAQDAQEDLAASAWWTVGGLLLGAIVAGFAGAAGSGAAHIREERVGTQTRSTTVR